MYRRSRGKTDFDVAVKKFLEHNRDPGRRLKSLRHAEEKATKPSEVKQLYVNHSSAIFFIFYSYFGSLESAILDRANRGRGYSELHLKELRETALPALERVLIYLPELIHRRWQYNAICLIIRKLLHPHNILKLRQDGVRLLTLWLHALQSNAGDASMQLFASAVPHFPPQKTPMGLPTPSPSSSPSLHHLHSSTHSLVERYGTYSSSDGSSYLNANRRASSTTAGSVREVVKVGSLQPLHRAVYAAPVGGADREVTIQLIHHLMDCLTEHVGCLHWEDTTQHNCGFAFLFFLFKLFYLACLFKNFRTEAGLYSQPPAPNIKVEHRRNPSIGRPLDALHEDESSLDHGSRTVSTTTAPSSDPLPRKHFRRAESYRMSQVIKLDYDLSNPIYGEIKQLILCRVLNWLQPDKKGVSYVGPLRSPLPSPSFAPPSPLRLKSSFQSSGAQLISDMWFTSRDNVNLLCEICRQSFLGSLEEMQLIRRVIELYWSWVGGASSGGQPLFMMQPMGVAGGRDTHLILPSDPVRPSSPSSILPWEVVIRYDGHDSREVCAGLQPSLGMMIRHTSHVFLVSERKETRSSQLELCRRILRFYQDMVVMWILDHDSWEYLLSILLHLTLELLRRQPPPDRDASLAASLSATLLKTLLVCYLRASMATTVSGRLWDSLSAVLSSLTHWREVIEHWTFVMDTMTQILAQTVYGLDLKNLPLQRLLKEESMIGRRNRTPSMVPADLSTSPFTAFSDVETNTNLRGQSSRSVEERRRRLKERSQTVDVPQSPNFPEGRQQRYISIPAEGGSPYSSANFALRDSTGTTNGGRKERRASEMEGPTTDQVEVPIRSSSSEGHYAIITEEEEEEGEGCGPVSPAVSLPASLSVRTSSEVNTNCPPQQRSGSVTEEVDSGERSNEREELEISLTITNRHTPTPEPEIALSPGITFERGGSVEPLLETVEKPKTKRSLFGRGRYKSESASSGSGEGKFRRKSVPKIERDLVFTNESSEDSVMLLDDKGRSPAPEERLAVRCPPRDTSPLSPLTASWMVGDAVGETQVGVTVTDGPLGKKKGKAREKGPGVSQRVYKSSSEGNIYRLSILEGEEENTHSVLMTTLPMSRTGEKGSGSKNEKSYDFSPRDGFSSDIIPSAQTKHLGSPADPRSQSPVTPSLSPVHIALSSPRSTPSKLALRRGIAAPQQSGGNVATVTEDVANGSMEAPSGEFEGSRETEFPPTPLNHHMMLKHPFPINHSQTPSPPNVLSPSSPSSSQVGWTAVVSAVVWQRMLNILGDVNAIPDPAMHHLAFQTLLTVWRRLVELDANLGVSTDNQTTPPPPPYLPPLLIFLPWVLKACRLPPKYLAGRTVAVQLLCEMNIRHLRRSPTLEQLTLFYHLLQRALQPTSDTLNVAVKHCSKLFSHGLGGAGVMMGDCITACATVLGSRRGTDVPRIESLHLLGSMLFLPHLSPELRNRLVTTLLTAARTEPTKNTRCMALHLVGMMVFSEFSGRPSSYVPEALDVLLASLLFSDRWVSMTAIDMLSLLTEVAPQMLSMYPSMPARVLRAVCHSIAEFMTNSELKKAPWVSKVVITLLMCLRDWLMVLPLQQMVTHSQLPHTVVQEALKVLQAAATSCEVAQLTSGSIKNQLTVKLGPLDTLTSHNTTTRTASASHRGEQGTETPHTTVQPFSKEDEERVQVAARSVLTHLINLVGHFPFECGAAQMTSIVSEFHDAPSLKHLDDLSTEIFDSPRVQVFSFNDTAVVTLVEIPIEHTGLPPTVEPAKYHTRVIVRDVTGKYSWDCAMLYGPQMSPCPDGVPLITADDSEDSLSTTVDSTSLEVGGVGGVALPSMDPSTPYSEDPLQPPSWKTHANTNRDILKDLLKHIESTSPECLLYPGVAGLAEPVPIVSKAMRCLEEEMVAVVERQSAAETEYAQGACKLCSVCGVRETPPTYISAEFAYHHCRVLLSHLGMFSASRRDRVDLLERNNQLILELKHLDSTPAQSRMTYKVAVLYVAPGQEDKQSVLRNSRGSRGFEEFVAGLGWEVNMETHAGYMGGLKREFCACTTLPYYATSSEEVLFHVSTRMPSKGLDVEQKVRHLGNDEVHIVWSEHWRDYRRTIFKTQFADILIVIYPLPNRLFRIQLIKKQKQNILFGPLFDGALVNRKCLPSLVRATAINALRAQRSPLVGYRGRYEERFKYIQTIVQRKMKSSFEEFTQNVMHPLESLSFPTMSRISTRNQAPELEPLPLPLPMRQSGGKAASNLPPNSTRRGRHTSPLTTTGSAEFHPRHRQGHSPRTNLLQLANSGLQGWSPQTRRPRSNTNEDRRPQQSKSGSALYRGERLPRNRSVPEKLHKLHHAEGDTTPPTQGVVLSASGGSLMLKRPINIRRHRTASPSPTSRQPDTTADTS